MSLDRHDRLAFTKDEVDRICDEYDAQLAELLAILRQMTDWAGGVDAQRLPPPWPEMVRTAKAAIAKAEGR